MNQGPQGYGPPGGGWGQAPYGQQPYGQQPLGPTPPEDPGSTVLGFVAGFFCGFIGLIICLVGGKRDTRKGAIFGLVAQLVIGFFSGMSQFLLLRQMR